MLISTKGRYALRVLVDMVNNNGENEYICVNEIASRQEISKKYLESIMTLLSKNGIIEVAYGKNGGYKLNRKPEEYRLIDILNITEKDLAPVPCLEHNCEPCEISAKCAAFETWKGLHDLINSYFSNKTIADLMTKENIKCI